MNPRGGGSGRGTVSPAVEAHSAASEAGEIAGLRLSIQRLSAPRFATPEAVVGWFGAMQSQEYGYAKWSIGQRAPGVDEAAVDVALAEGTILRTHVLRPTWHYVRREDIRWLQAATRQRVISAMRPYDRPLELDEKLYARCNEIIGRALEGGNHRTRAQLSEALAAAGIVASGQRLGHIVMRAELDALICSGIPRGKQTTYALVAERAPEARELGPEEALVELTRRYFTSHGPATEKDFRWWSSLTAREARRGMEMVAGELESMKVGEWSLWWIPQDVPPPPNAGDIHLVQIYDECIVGYTESRGALDPGGIARGVGVASTFPHAILMNGHVTGRWKRQVKGDGMTVHVQPLRRWSAAERRALRREVERFGRFNGLLAEVTIQDLP